jgi:hypothetical protein
VARQHDDVNQPEKKRGFMPVTVLSLLLFSYSVLYKNTDDWFSFGYILLALLWEVFISS